MSTADTQERERLLALIACGIYETPDEDGYLDAIRADERARALLAALTPQSVPVQEPVAWTTPYDLETIAPGDGYIGTLYGRPNTDPNDDKPDPRMVPLYRAPVPVQSDAEPTPEVLRAFAEWFARRENKLIVPYGYAHTHLATIADRFTSRVASRGRLHARPNGENQDDASR